MLFRSADGILNWLVLVVGRGVMVGHTEDIARTQAFESAFAHPRESLRRRHFMTEKPVDVKLLGTIIYVLHHVAVPNFVKERISHFFLYFLCSFVLKFCHKRG